MGKNADGGDASVPDVPKELEQERVLSVADALEKINANKEIHGVTISGLTLRGAFSHPVVFRRVTLTRLSVISATFEQGVSFLSCHVDRPKIARSTFGGGLDLRGSRLKNFRLEECTVAGPFRADKIEAKGAFTLISVQFLKSTRFWEARFHGWFDAKACKFADTADFRSLTADEGFSATQSEFAADFLFRGSSVQKKTDFDGSRFEAALDLSKAKLHDFVYLEDIVPGPRQSFVFNNAVADKVRVRVEQLDGRIQAETQRDHEQAMHEYGLLKHNFANLHRYEAEDWAFYRFKVNARRATTRPTPMDRIRQFLSWVFLDLGCAYGTSPGRAVRAAIVIMLVFAAAYFTGFHQFENVATIVGDDRDALGNRLVFSAVESISVFTAGLAGNQLHDARGWILIPLTLEAILGTLLWGLFIVAFGRKVIR